MTTETQATIEGLKLKIEKLKSRQKNGILYDPTYTLVSEAEELLSLLTKLAKENDELKNRVNFLLDKENEW